MMWSFCWRTCSCSFLGEGRCRGSVGERGPARSGSWEKEEIGRKVVVVLLVLRRRCSSQTNSVNVGVDEDVETVHIVSRQLMDDWRGSFISKVGKWKDQCCSSGCPFGASVVELILSLCSQMSTLVKCQQ